MAVPSQLVLLALAALAQTAAATALRAPKATGTLLASAGQPAASLVEENEDPEEVFNYQVSRPVKVVMWDTINSPWFPLAQNTKNCNVDRAYMRDNSTKGVTVDPDLDISDADVVVFNAALLAYDGAYVLPRHKLKGQLWVAYCSEPPLFLGTGIQGDCSLLRDPVTMSVMDAVSSYDPDSEFPSFFTPPTEAQMRRQAPDFSQAPWLSDSMPSFFASDALPLATFVSSDCRADKRQAWVAELNATLEKYGSSHSILAYGDCYKNADEVKCSRLEDNVQKEEFSDLVLTVLNRCMARPFALVAENTDSPWYVSEKVWFALASGQVPVYLGTKEVKNLVPPGSLLYAGDYATTTELVQAMLAFDDAAHEQARAWKAQPMGSWNSWAEARKLSHMTLAPRLCEAAADRPAIRPDAPLTEVPERPSQTWLAERSSTRRSEMVAERSTTSGPKMFIQGMGAAGQQSSCRALPFCGGPAPGV